MRNLFLGFVIGALVYGNCAHALEVTFDKFTTLDLYRCAALCGTIASGYFTTYSDKTATYANDCAVALYNKRGSR